MYVVEDKTVLGAIMLADVIREESKEAVARLHDMGKRVAMLTGDSKGVAAWVAKELGIKEILVEKERLGKTSHFAVVELDSDCEAGSIVRAKIYNANDNQLMANII